MNRIPTIITIASGKGGVGKSVCAVNLAETLAQNGHRVALVDVDLGQGGCAVLLNETPEASLLDLALHSASPTDVLHETSSGITLVQAVADPRKLDGHEAALYPALDSLLERLQTTHDIILLDAPAGTGTPVRWAFDRADLGVFTLVGEPTAIADAYRLAKLVWHADPAYPMATVVNFADTEEEARSVAYRFGRITQRFMLQMPAYLGWIPYSPMIRRSVAEQRPAVRTPGAVQKAFDHLASVLLHGEAMAGHTENVG